MPNESPTKHGWRAKAQAAREEKKSQWFKWSCGAIEIREYDYGFMLFVPGRQTAYYAHLESVLNSGRLRDHLTLRGTDEERAGIAQLKETMEHTC